MAEVSLRSLPICISLKTPWRRERRPTPVFWPGKFHGLYSLWCHKKSGTTEGFSLHGDNLVTRYKAKHALWLFSDTKSISISNLAGCAYIWSMNLQGREEGCQRKQMDWKNVSSSLWISGFSAAKWESYTKWSLKSLPAPKCPHFTYHQSNWIIGLRKFRSFPEAFEKYLKKN